MLPILGLDHVAKSYGDIGAFPGGRVDGATMHRRSSQILSKFDPGIDPGLKLKRLSVAQRHLVQIARARSNDARVLIMDEPIASLSHREAQELFAITRRLRDEVRAILFISHRFDEVFALCDRYAVFRNDAAVGHGTIAGTNRDSLIRLMVGRDISSIYPKQRLPVGREMLRVEGLGRGLEYADVSFDMHAGEILGVYGRIGAGRSEVMQALFGTAPADNGLIIRDGEEIVIASARAAIAHGIGFVPEDRQSQGVHLRLPIVDNITMASLGHGFLKRRASRSRASGLAADPGVKMSGLDQRVEELSGGNQRKLVIAKWLATTPLVLILDEPTRGIDIRAKAQVHRLMSGMAARGVAEKAIVAMAFLIIAGKIDISAGGIIAFCSTVMGLVSGSGMPAAVIIAVAIATGLATGCVNGLLVTRAWVPSIVATIGTMTLFRDIAYAVLGDGVLKTYPPELLWLGQGFVTGPVSFELVRLIAVAAIAGIVLHTTAFGRRVIATGSMLIGVMAIPALLRRIGLAAGRA